MRHRVAGNHLGHSAAHHQANMRNLTNALIRHELIKTTLAKAKAMRRVAEPLITRAKQDSVANRRLAFNRLRDREMVQKLFNELGPRYSQRPGGYLRVLRCGFRAGDAAPMAYVELVDRVDGGVQAEATAEKKAKRGKKAQAEKQPAEKKASRKKAAAA